MNDKFDITELEYIFYSLRSVLTNFHCKHSADVIAPKAVVMKHLDAMARVMNAYGRPEVLTDNNTVDLLLKLKDASKQGLPFVLSTKDVNTILKIAEELH